MKLYRIITTVMFLSPILLVAQSNLDQAKTAIEAKDYLAAAPFARQAVLEKPNDPEALFIAMTAFSEIEVHDTAVMYGSRLYDEDHDKPEYVHGFALALTRAGQPNEAVGILRRLMRKNDDVRTSLLLVNALTDADSLSAAELVAATAKKKFPNSADAYFALGLLYYKYKPQPVLELAVQNLTEAVKLDDNLVLAHFALAECYWKQANRESDQELANTLFKRSLVEWNKVTTLEPLNARAWFEQGKIFFLAEKWNDAVYALLQYRKLRPVGTGSPIASWYLGTSYFKLNRCDSAQVHLDDAAKLIDSLKGPASLQLAKCKFLSKDWQGASQTYAAALSKGPMEKWESVDVWYYGASLVLAADTLRGIEVMWEAARRDPKQCQFMFRFGVLLQKGQTTKSTDIFRQRLVNCKDSLDARIHYLIGNNFFADSLVDSAIAEYKLALDIEPENGFYQTRLAETYLIKGMDADAFAIYDKVIAKGIVPTATDPEKQAAIQSILKLNAADANSKAWAKIVDRCKQGMQIDPKNKYLMLYMAFGYQGQGNTDDACKWYKELLKVDPANESGKKNAKALGC